MRLPRPAAPPQPCCSSPALGLLLSHLLFPLLPVSVPGLGSKARPPLPPARAPSRDPARSSPEKPPRLQAALPIAVLCRGARSGGRGGGCLSGGRPVLLAAGTRLERHCPGAGGGPQGAGRARGACQSRPGARPGAPESLGAPRVVGARAQCERRPAAGPAAAAQAAAHVGGPGKRRQAGRAAANTWPGGPASCSRGGRLSSGAPPGRLRCTPSPPPSPRCSAARAGGGPAAAGSSERPLPEASLEAGQAPGFCRGDLLAFQEESRTRLTAAPQPPGSGGGKLMPTQDGGSKRRLGSEEPVSSPCRAWLCALGQLSLPGPQPARL